MSVMVLGLEELAEVYEGLNSLYPKGSKRNFEMVNNLHRMNVKTYAARYREEMGEVYTFTTEDLLSYNKKGNVSTEQLEYQLSGLAYNITDDYLDFTEKLELIILNGIIKSITSKPLPFPTDAVRII